MLRLHKELNSKSTRIQTFLDKLNDTALARIPYFSWVYCLICCPCNLIKPRASKYSGGFRFVLIRTYNLIIYKILVPVEILLDVLWV